MKHRCLLHNKKTQQTVKIRTVQVKYSQKLTSYNKTD